MSRRRRQRGASRQSESRSLANTQVAGPAALLQGGGPGPGKLGYAYPVSPEEEWLIKTGQT
jgi:hypothetical protein